VREVPVEGFSVIGKSISHYRITEKLGSGGMGVVYRAEDTNLSRQVAIKVLPDIFSGDPERLARFEREAKLLASLNHPNIAAIHGLEEAAGKRFLVLELVEGETLAQRIDKGPLPVEEALEVCRQIAEGVEAAHEKGIIHRDLKPANVKITPEGKVKVLDFGLAKAFHDQPTSPESPTISEMTRPGVLLGTAAYMSPEQAKGKTVDERADIWAFGCVLFECLTGKRAFEGETVTETLAAILKAEPDWGALPTTMPSKLKDLLCRCLRKDIKKRLHDIADVRIEIEEVSASPEGSIASSGKTAIETARRTSSIMWFVGLIGLIVGSLATGLLYQWLRGPGAEPTRQVIRALIDVAPADRLQSQPRDVTSGEQRPSQTAIALSPDGRLLAFSAVKGDRQQLYRRSIDQLEATPIDGTKGGASPFFSPDGKWIGFWADGELQKIAVAGGPATPICETALIFGAGWGENDAIVFAGDTTSLFQVPASGGTPHPVTTLDERKGEVSHRLPYLMPGGKVVLFTVITHFMPDWDMAEIWAERIPNGKRTFVVRGSDARYVPATGHLVFVRSGTVVAAPFDAERLEITGGAVTVISDVMQAAYTTSNAIETGSAQLAMSSSGLLVYATGGVFRSPERLPVWVDRATGKVQPLPLPPRAYYDPHLSPDGQQILMWTQGKERIVWVYDMRRGTTTRVTTEGRNSRAIWTPDGRRATFASSIAGPEYIALKPPDSSSGVERLATIGQPSSWSPDGRVLAFVDAPSTGSGAQNYVVWLLSVGDGQPRRFLNSRFNETYPEFSPDGNWIAYVSDESGQAEVYVKPYPGPGQSILLSNSGGTQPAWRHDMRELFYTKIDAQTRRTQMMSVSITTVPTLAPGVPRLLWKGQFQRQSNTRGYDVTPDGQHFLMIQQKERPPTPVTQLVVVQNWFEELKRLAPTGKR
jgi:serine/threonine protein kinase/Tol biopolymer transport system component